MKAALDAIVLKQGVFNLVFHPHGWIKNEQVVELIDHAVKKHGKKVKFLTFREAQDRLDKNLLGGQPLRDADGATTASGCSTSNNDGFLDVVIGNAAAQRDAASGIPKAGTWRRQPTSRPVHARRPARRARSASASSAPDGRAVSSLVTRGDDARALALRAAASWIEDRRAVLDGLRKSPAAGLRPSGGATVACAARTWTATGVAS